MVQNTSAEYMIYKDLRQKILTGEIQDRERLVETTLASAYQASRLHIKSALRLLEQENLAQHILKCGFVAKSLSPQAIEEIVELRIALERVVFKKLAETITDGEIAQLKKIVQRVAVFMENDMVEDAMEELDLYYSICYEKSGLERIPAILDVYTDYLKIIRRRSAEDKAQNLASLKLLQDMTAAMEKRDVETLLHHIERRRSEAE